MIEAINNETEKALVNIGLVENDVTATLYKYKYNGKEFQDELGLSWYDYGARNYDPAVGRWMNVDPMTDNYFTLTPYNYVGNNPIYYIDYKGKFILPIHFARKYERLAHYLANDIQQIANNPKVMSSLKKYGQFTDSQIKNALKWGQGPIINIKKLKNAYGSFQPNVKSNILNIDVDLVEALEVAKGRDRDYLLFLVAVTILHEFVHYGDDQDGVDYVGEIGLGEEGNAFEIEAYGMVIDKAEAKELIDKYLREKKKGEDEKRKKKASLERIIKNFDKLEEGEYKWNGDDFVIQ